MPKPRKKANGTWTLVVQYAGNRRNLTLGKIPKSQADGFANDVNALIEHVKYGGKSMPQRLQAWVSDLSEKHKNQLSDIGLFEYKSAGVTVRQLLAEYLDDYKTQGHEESTVTKVRSTIQNRFDKINKVRVDKLEPVKKSIGLKAEPVWTAEARKILTSFNSWQRNHFAPATWTRDNKLLVSVGIWAQKHGIIDHNPFTILPTASMVNDERNAYVSRESIMDVMESCLSPDIRLTIAMGRFAGMRTCSEVRTMKWSHIDADAGTLTIIDSKKKKPRVMPLFDDIRAELERQREFTGETRFVASPQLRSASSSNNYQKIKDAISRSGQEPWDRVRQNLRTSCENDLLDTFDERLVTQWIGHTIHVSREHYQKLRPSDYQAAIKQAANNSVG
jgi:integrase